MNNINDFHRDFSPGLHRDSTGTGTPLPLEGEGQSRSMVPSPSESPPYLGQKIPHAGSSVTHPSRARLSLTGTYMTKLVALLLVLLALGCSLDTSAAPTMLAGLSCDWEAGETVLLPPDAGYCWSSPDPEVVITPDWVNSPCEVDRWRRDSWEAGESVRTWARIWTLSEQRGVELVSKECL